MPCVGVTAIIELTVPQGESSIKQVAVMLSIYPYEIKQAHLMIALCTFICTCVPCVAGINYDFLVIVYSWLV